MTKHEVLQSMMARIDAGEDAEDVLFDLLLELDEWFKEA